MTTLVRKDLKYEIAQLCQSFQIGTFSTSTPSLRTIFVGELDEDCEEGIWLVESPSPEPHRYIDTEYQIIDFWSRSPHSDRAQALLQLVYDNFHRRYAFDTANWHISFSHAIGSIVDVDRDKEHGKLYRLSVQFICRNKNNLS